MREFPDGLAALLGHSDDDVITGTDPHEIMRGPLADWLIRRLPDKHTAIASNFEFVRSAVAREAVKATAWQNAVIGGVAIIPGADMPLMTLNQGKMLLQIAAAYGQQLGAERVKELAAVVGGGLVFRALARQALTLAPGAGLGSQGRDRLQRDARDGDRRHRVLREGRRHPGDARRPEGDCRKGRQDDDAAPEAGPARMTDLWPRVERLLARVERPARYIDREWGARHAPEAGYRVALLYPDTFELGMANQAIGILYDRLNRLDGVAAERVFLPWKDMAAAMRDTEVPLFTLESCAPVSECDLLGVTLPYELTYTNVLEALDLAGIPLRSADRTEAHPLVVGGGPCSYNPEPLAEFLDAILIGEGEDAAGEIVQAHRDARSEGLSREGLLERLAGIQGVYVPSLYEPASAEAPARPRAGSSAPPVVRKRVLATLSDDSAPACPVVPFMDVVHDRATVEILRGCTRGCRFCQAGMVYRPVRERSADEVVRDAVARLRCTGYEDVSLTSLSTTDHSRIEEVLRRLGAAVRGTGVSISLPSLRVDSFGVEMAALASAGNRGGLTFAPEAATQRLRDVINKNVTEEDLLETVSAAFAAGWRRVKLYFMCGLPTETDEDVAAIGALVKRVLETARQATPPAQRGGIRVGVSVAVFVPKAHTPFQWEGQLPLEEVRRRQRILRESIPRKGVDLSWHDPDVGHPRGRARPWRTRSGPRDREGLEIGFDVRCLDGGVRPAAMARRFRGGGRGCGQPRHRAARPGASAAMGSHIGGPGSRLPARRARPRDRRGDDSGLPCRRLHGLRGLPRSGRGHRVGRWQPWLRGRSV